MAAAYLKNWDQIKKVGHACSEDTKVFRGGGGSGHVSSNKMILVVLKLLEIH